jgi:outer membrane protein OmpA-like peptidoglycan-associated protein
MLLIKILNRLLIFFWCLFLISCQSVPTETVTKPAYLSYEEGIRKLSHGLLTKLQQRQNLSPEDRVTLVFNPFLDVDSGQILQVSLDIEEKFFEETRKHFKNVNISRLTLSNLKTADYIINGIIKYESKKSSIDKYYQISASIVDLSTKTIVTNGTVGIVSSGLDYNPTASYEDNPMYIKGKLVEYILKTVQSPVGTQVDYEEDKEAKNVKDSKEVKNAKDFNFIEVEARLVEAQTAYDNGNYEQARLMFKEVLKQPDGKIIEAYGGLYATNFKLGNLEEAEQNFGDMVAVGVKNRRLPVKFFFQSQMRDFLDVPLLRQQYTIWLRQIGLYFKNHPNHCVNIIGHTSRHGIYHFNKELSKRRAERIQFIMSQTFSGIFEHSKTIGKGSDETIVGTMPDSAENAIDRRVEFQITDC